MIDSGWDVKRLDPPDRDVGDLPAELRCARRACIAGDPDNMLLARGPRFRLSAEMIRDGALAASGLLVDTIGGPPVKPFQPPGLWEEKSGLTYQRDAGAGSHRRSLYTFWKRTSPPPAMLTFDATTREVCAVKRQTTATPLQALVLLNDPQFVEAARALAQRAMKEGGADPRRPDHIRRSHPDRPPAEPAGAGHARGALPRAVRRVSRGTLRSRASCSPSATLRSIPALDPAECAAMTVLAQAILNHDETVMNR